MTGRDRHMIGHMMHTGHCLLAHRACAIVVGLRAQKDLLHSGKRVTWACFNIALVSNMFGSCALVFLCIFFSGKSLISLAA